MKEPCLGSDLTTKERLKVMSLGYSQMKKNSFLKGRQTIDCEKDLLLAMPPCFC